MTCPRCQGRIEDTDLRCPICGHATVRPAERAEVVTKTLRCTSCAAAMAYDTAHRAPACVYCDAVLTLEERTDPLETVERWLPFTLAPEDARAALRRWMESLGPFRPGDLRDASHVHELTPVWWVAWRFDAKALVSWTADTNADTGKADWAPCGGQQELRFDSVLVPATKGLTWTETSVLASTYDLQRTAPPSEGPPGAQQELFAVRRSAARQRVDAALRFQARQRVHDQLPGTKRRHLDLAVVVHELDTRRYGLPAYVLAYRYRGELHRAVISGQDGACVLAEAPWSPWRIAAAVVAGVGVLTALVGLVPG